MACPPEDCGGLSDCEELAEATERGQIRAREGSVRHVEVFRMDGVRTSIIGRPRPLSRQRRADHLYTLNFEEPQKVMNGFGTECSRGVDDIQIRD